MKDHNNKKTKYAAQFNNYWCFLSSLTILEHSVTAANFTTVITAFYYWKQKYFNMEWLEYGVSWVCAGVNGNGFTLVGESGQASAMSHRLKVINKNDIISYQLINHQLVINHQSLTRWPPHCSTCCQTTPALIIPCVKSALTPCSRVSRVNWSRLSKTVNNIR